MLAVADSNQKGAVAEAEIAAAAIRLGIPVLKPLSEHGRYDLVFDLAGRLARIQCKWGRLDRDGDVISVRVGTSRFTPRGYVVSCYTTDEIDYVAVYSGELDRCFLLPATQVVGSASSTCGLPQQETPSGRVLPLPRTLSSLGL